MPDSGQIPTQDSISPAWLTEQLQRSGLNSVVSEFTATRIGTGQIGTCIRYELSYADGTSGPASLVGKFPSDDPTSRATGVALRNYLREVRFYQELQARLTIRTPRCYFAEIVAEGPEFFLLLEDMTPAEQGNQLAGCDPAAAEAAVLQLVGLHAPSWNDDSLRAAGWLVGEPVPADQDPTRDLYRAQLPGFMDYFGDRLAADERHIIERVGAVDHGPLFQRDHAPFSLVHVDYRLDNLLFAPSGEVTAVDWQSITLGAPLNDVAYFMGAGLMPAVRRDVEQGIVQKYHAKLGAAGVQGFDWAACWERYRRGTFAGFAVTVIAANLVQHTERGDAMFTAMAQRHARHALDLGAEEFLS